jgi:hypothetical protein
VDRLAEQVVELGGGHAPLELGPADDGAEEPVGVEERLLPEAQVVDADDASQSHLEVAGVRVHLANGVTDDPVGVVVQVRAGGGERADDAALDERDEAALV